MLGNGEKQSRFWFTVNGRKGLNALMRKNTKEVEGNSFAIISIARKVSGIFIMCMHAVSH